MDKIQVLQLGGSDWRECYTIPDTVEFDYVEILAKMPQKKYDLFFFDRVPSDQEVFFLYKMIQAYTLYVIEGVELSDRARWLYESKKGKRLAKERIQDFLLYETRYYFPKPYGEKFHLKNLAAVPGFSGNVKWEGEYCVQLEGDFGSELNQAAFWRNNLPLYQGQCLDLWLEYQKDEEVSIALVVTQFWQADHSGGCAQKWKFSEEELGQEVQIDNQMADGMIFVSLLAKGKGKLRIIGLHHRHSRRSHGSFLPGGKRYVASNREEVFCYFDPGDMKPPLNVYFSRYKKQEGFEGHDLMRSMGSPFLLIAEARLEGGSFYIGSEEYESFICDAVINCMKELKFTSDQVILTGISMGSFGALYYGCDIRPYAVILGKPLLSIGDVAVNERLCRPGGFGTSLDILRYLSGGLDQSGAERLNRKFWDKFDGTDWGKTKILASYMIEDDYDSSAYPKLISRLHSEGVQIYGKGFHGRHNDNNNGILDWFSNQMKQILSNDFHRKVDG